MKRFFTLVLLGIFLSGCAADSSDSRSEEASALVSKLCDAENDLTWQERANLAAQANALDIRWERLSDAVNFVAGEVEIDKLRKSIDNSLNYGSAYLEVLYQSRLNYAKFAAECSIVKEGR